MNAQQVFPRGFEYRFRNYRYHVVISFQESEKEEIMYVVKYYGKHHRWWHYEIVGQEFISDVVSGKYK